MCGVCACGGSAGRIPALGARGGGGGGTICSLHKGLVLEPGQPEVADLDRAMVVPWCVSAYSCSTDSPHMGCCCSCRPVSAYSCSTGSPHMGCCCSCRPVSAYSCSTDSPHMETCFAVTTASTVAHCPCPPLSAAPAAPASSCSPAPASPPPLSVPAALCPALCDVLAVPIATC